MSEQRILSTAEWNELCRDQEAERNRKPECCCGKPIEIDGVTYDRVNAGCQVHGTLSRWVEPSMVTQRDANPDRKRHAQHAVSESS